LAVIASAAALWISDVPLAKPIAAVMVGYIDGQFVINPTNKQMEKSRLNLTVAGTKDAVLMIEGSADFLPEDLMIEAVATGHSVIKVICEALEAFGNVVGKPKYLESLVPIPEGLAESVDVAIGPKIDDMYNIEGGKESFGAAMSKLSKEVNDSFDDKYPNNKSEVKEAFKDLLIRKMFEKAKKTGTRYDGRAFNEIRAIDIETSILPRVHGSALFTRGQTQALATVTLGDSGMKQKIDTLDGLEQKRFYLQYNFPPSSVGETGRVGAPGRREIGHGNLAERYGLTSFICLIIC
jgi:polyribonucleotide nucleotidyltransferase